MTESANPHQWIIIVPFAVILCVGYAVCCIRAGYVHVGDRLQRVYRDKEPRSFWFSVLFGGAFMPLVLIGGAIWDLTN